MKNEKIINALDKIKSGGETKQQIFDEIMQKSQQKKRAAFKPVKILAAAAAVMFIVGLINIQTVMAFIGGLFFVPGIGITNNDTITTVSIEKPVEIKCAYGDLTLQFMTKITCDGKSDLVLYIDSSAYLSINDLKLAIDVNGQILEPTTWGGGGGSGPGVWNAFFKYQFAGFPDVNEFDLLVRGVPTHIILTESDNRNIALSKENNGITMALHKFPQVTSMLGIDIIDKNTGKNEYNTFIYLSPDYCQIYDKNGDTAAITGANGNWGSDSFKINIIQTAQNNSEIKRLKCNAVEIDYYYKSSEKIPGTADLYAPIYPVIEIPVPKDGETIKTDCQVTIGSHIYKITEVRRENDVIYFKDNEMMDVIRELDAEKEAAEGNSYIYIAWRFIENYPNKQQTFIENDHKITGFDPDAEILKIMIHGLNIIQFGDFDVEFD